MKKLDEALKRKTANKDVCDCCYKLEYIIGFAQIKCGEQVLKRYNLCSNCQCKFNVQLGAINTSPLLFVR